MDLQSLEQSVLQDLSDFVENADKSLEYCFGPLSSRERQVVYRVAARLGLYTTSVNDPVGSENKNKCIVCYNTPPTLMKRNKPVVYIPPTKLLSLSTNVFLFPLNKTEIDCIMLAKSNQQKNNSVMDEKDGGLLTDPSVPLPQSIGRKTCNYQKSFRIYKYKGVILEAIKDNQITIIYGGIGSGKSTQIPQYLLEDAYKNRSKCFIMVSEPYPIMALNTCNRISKELGEEVGGTLGYQIPLETKISFEKTCLLYTTPSVLVRTLISEKSISQKSFFLRATHIIIDSADERECITDFLFIALRDMVSKNRNLKLILIQNSEEVANVRDYFKCLATVNVSDNNFCGSRLFYLPDILRALSYNNPPKSSESSIFEKYLSPQEASACVETDNEFQNLFNEAVENGTNEILIKLINMVLLRKVSVNHRNKKTGQTILFLACVQGRMEFVDMLLKLEANVLIKSNEGLTAYDLAVACQHTEVIERLRQHQMCNEDEKDDFMESLSSTKMDEEDKRLCSDYYSNFKRHRAIYFDLLIALIMHVHSKYKIGDILVFLPNFSEILALRDLLLDRLNTFDPKAGHFKLYCLYAEMQTHLQKEALSNTDGGIRKIILSTDIGALCAANDDLRFVIDTGKVEQKLFNNKSELFSSRIEWATKKCMDQRTTCVGRVQLGNIYRLYPKSLYDKRPKVPINDIKCSSLEKLCLYAGKISPRELISTYLLKSIDHPARNMIHRAICILKKLDALDNEEHLTNIGDILLQLPVQPQYGKMILSALALQCLDPILTIVACLTHRVLCNLDVYGSLMHIAADRWTKESNNCLSDHSVLIKIFLQRQAVATEQKAKEICNRMMVDPATMELVNTTRVNIVGHLRALGLIKVKGGCDMKFCNVNSEKWSTVKAALVSGNYHNVLYVDRKTSILRDGDGNPISLNPSTVLFDYQHMNVGNGGNNQSGTHEPQNDNLYQLSDLIPKFPSDWIIYDQMNSNPSGSTVQMCTVVSPLSLILFAGCINISSNKENKELVEHILNRGKSPDLYYSDSEDENPETKHKLKFVLDDNLQFYLDINAARFIIHFRVKWFSYFNRRLLSQCHEKEQSLVQVIVSMLEIEDAYLGFNQIKGIGLKPATFVIDIQKQVYNSCGREICKKTVNTSRDLLKKWRNDQAMAAEKASLKKQQETAVLMRTIDQPNCKFFIASKADVFQIKNSLDSGIWHLDRLSGYRTLESFKIGYPTCLFFILHGRYFCGFGFFTEILPNSSSDDSFEIPIKVHWLKQGLVPVNEVREKVGQELPTNGQGVHLQGASFLRSFWNIRRMELITICQ